MKKYTLLWHIFELDPRAYDYLASYVSRIDIFATSNTVAQDILDDIKYNIIEKLYTSESPINEAFVMNIAQTIGEPEQIFDNKSEIDDNDAPKKNLLERRFGKEKPMIWGVAYWISKSLNISVSTVRIIFFVAILIYGTSLWLYPLLALFVPFKDKKSTTGQTGNMFFELIRIIIWIGVIFILLWILLGWLLGVTVFLVLPLLSNQSLQALVPSYLYPLTLISLLSLVVLIIGSIGALIKKSWISKTVALITITIIVGSCITAGITGLMKVSQYNYNPKSVDTQSLTGFITNDDTIIINLRNNKQSHIKWNYFDWIFGERFTEDAMFQNIELLASKDNEVHIEVIDTINVLEHDQQEKILSKRSKIMATISGNSMDIMLPSTIFVQEVPFSFAERTINIYVPTDKKIVYNNNSELRYGTPDSWYEKQQDKEYMVYCKDKLSFNYHIASESWRCADMTLSEVNKGSEDPSNDDVGTPDRYDGDIIEGMFQGLAITQAYDLAGSKSRSLRVIQRDWEELAVTQDYRPGRINVKTQNGLITDVEIE